MLPALHRSLTHQAYADSGNATWHALSHRRTTRSAGWAWWERIRTPDVGVLDSSSVWADCAGHLVGRSGVYLPDHCYWYYSPGSSEIWRTVDSLTGHYVDGLVLDLATSYADNLYHFLYDCLPRLQLLEDAGLTSLPYDAKLMPSPQNSLAKAIVARIPVPDCPTLALKPSQMIQARRMIAPSYPSWAGGPAEWAVQFLRRYCASLSAPTNLRLFVSRRGRDRDLNNLDDVLGLLRGYGFIEYFAGSDVDDLKWFSQAEAIVAPHGAGLAAIFCCRPDTILIELTSEAETAPMYARIASFLKMRYSLLVGTLAGKDRMDPGPPIETLTEETRRELFALIRQPFTVDVNLLRALLVYHRL